MRSTTLALLPLTLTLALAVEGARGQVPAIQTRESRGLFAAAPAALVLDGQSPFAPDQVHFKRPGFLPSQAPTKWPPQPVPAGRPDFDLQVAFRRCGATRPLEVDAVSIGEDWVLANPCTGDALVPPGR
jgi:hypothetical protein